MGPDGLRMVSDGLGKESDGLGKNSDSDLVSCVCRILS